MSIRIIIGFVASAFGLAGALVGGNMLAVAWVCVAALWMWATHVEEKANAPLRAKNRELAGWLNVAARALRHKQNMPREKE